MPEYIRKINQKIKEMTENGYTPNEAIYELALNAGLEYFNPYKATEGQLRAIAMEI